MEQPPADLTRMLHEVRAGDSGALDRLMPLVYDELHRLASGKLAGHTGHTLQPTALIHEAYLRLAGRNLPEWQDRAHFFAVAATIMRQILVDHARSRESLKRGGAFRRIDFDEQLAYSDERSCDLVALDDALQALAEFDPRKARIVELRFFAGLSVPETAEALSLSTATVGREARVAEAWLLREMTRR